MEVNTKPLVSESAAFWCAHHSTAPNMARNVQTLLANVRKLKILLAKFNITSLVYGETLASILVCECVVYSKTD